MTQLDARHFTISKQGMPVVGTVAGAEPVSALHARELNESRAAWQDSIDNKLIEWGRSPGRIEEEDLEMPSSAAVRRASELATYLRDIGAPHPRLVVPNGEGGIVFERSAGRVFETIEFHSNGTMEVAYFEDHQLLHRQTYP